MFIDRAKVFVKAGDGGDGCTSFYRDRRIRRGRPDGGDGGDGGDIILKVDKNIQTLLDFQYKRHFKAGRGGHGSSNNKKGKHGENLYIRIPPGTVIKDAGTFLVLRDLVNMGDEVVIARGGEHGKGNTKYGDGTRGVVGVSKEILLELKLIADVGIIGFPNAGKSTFISRISRAKSKIASYPFTTKTPMLGIVRLYGEEELTFADMPGLIEGAHSGRGLGDQFLRHIERTSLLLHMIDADPQDQRDPHKDYIAINNELSLYGEGVSKKTQVIACNKMDLPGAEENFKKLKQRIGSKVFPISALTGSGIKELLNEVFTKFKKYE